MRLCRYNSPRTFDNGIVWVRLQRSRRSGFAVDGFGLWFSRSFPWIWLLTPWSNAPVWAHSRALKSQPPASTEGSK